MTTTATQPDVPERDCEYPTTPTFPNAQRTGVAVAARRSALLAHGFFAAALVELPLAFVRWRIARREVAAVLLVPAQDESDWLDPPRSRAGLRRLPPPGGLH